MKTFFQNTRNDQKRVCRQSDAGSAHVAVLSVAPWEEYVTALQPTFALTVDQAMNEVLPATSTAEETVLRALVANMEAALPTATMSKSVTETFDASGVTSTVGERKTNEASGNVSSVPDAPSRDAIGFSTDRATIAGALPIDPMMRRMAALALYQESQILSRFVADATVPDGYRPYVVRLQVTLMPNARREPYDAYATVTFLPTALPDLTRTEGNTVYESVQSGVNLGLVRVVPLLVTDNIESTRRADMSQQIRDLSASILAMTSNIGISAGVRSQLNRLAKSQSNDFNSLLTVARLSENSVRVRLGAIHGNGQYAMIPRTHNITVLVMVPKEAKTIGYIAKSMMHDAVHGTPLSAGRTGVFGWRLEDVIEPWVRAYEVPEDTGVYVELLSFAQSANYAAFRSHVINSVFPDAKCASRCKLNDHTKKGHWAREAAAEKAANEKAGKPVPAYCDCDALEIKFSPAFRDTAIDRMWADVSNYNGMGQYSEGTFDLPASLASVRRFYTVDDVTPLDNTTSLTVVRVRGARFVDPSRVRARLRVEKNGSIYYFEPTSIVPKTADELEVRFPSVWKMLGLAKAPAASGNATPTRNAEPPTDERAIGQRSALLLSYAASPYRAAEEPFGGSDDHLKLLNAGKEITYPAPTFIFDHEKKPLTAGFTSSCATPFLIAEKNAGRLKFSLKKSKDGPEKMFFTIRGADVSSIQPAPSFDKKQMFATDDETYEVSLTNLTPLTDVIVSAHSVRDGETLKVEDIRVRVVEAPEKKDQKSDKSEKGE